MAAISSPNGALVDPLRQKRGAVLKTALLRRHRAEKAEQYQRSSIQLIAGFGQTRAKYARAATPDSLG
jgi:hypothetical protein